MFLKKLFSKYADLSILKYFLEHPEEIHVKELSRRTKISAPTVSAMCKEATKDNLLEHRKVANVHLYKLNENHPKVKALREVIK